MQEKKIVLKDQKGAVPILVIAGIVGVLGIMAIANLAPFKNSFLASLYPKDRSFAAVSGPISGPVSPSPVASASGTITARPTPCLYTTPGSCDVTVSYTITQGDASQALVKIRETGETVSGFRSGPNGSWNYKYPMRGDRSKTTFDLLIGNQLVNSAVHELETDPFTQKNITVTPSVVNTTQNVTVNALLTTNRNLTVDLRADVREVATGKGVASKLLTGQQFIANQSKTTPLSIEIPQSVAAGTYRVDFVARNPVNGLFYINNQGLTNITINKTTFNASALTNPTSVKRGSSIDISVDATASIDTTLRVAIEVMDSQGVRKFSKFFDNQSMSANQPKTVTTPWLTPANLVPGNYTVNVYLQRAVNPELYYTKTNAASFTVTQ